MKGKIKMVSIYEVTGRELVFLHGEETNSLVVGMRLYLLSQLDNEYDIERVLESAKFEGNNFLKVNFFGRQIIACDEYEIKNYSGGEYCE
jgi:hypothetical protein